MELGQGSLDRALDNALAERLIASQFAEIGPPRITGRYGGMDHHAVEIDDAWIFRFPKRAECEPMLLRELRLLPHIEGLIPVQVPAYRCIGKPTPEYPWTFVGYRKLAGTPAIECPPDRIDLAELASSLGRILSALHGCDPDSLVPLGVVRLDEFEDIGTVRTETLEELAQVRPKLEREVYDPCRAFVSDDGRAFPTEPPRACLLHGDLDAEHLLIDPDGRLAGLIDWADACLGDPAYDFKFLWVWPGDDFIARVLEQYTSSVDRGFLDRVQFYGVCTAVGQVAYGLASGRDENLRLGLAALRRAFADRPGPR
jgi:aminoglycoside 2''-phosphotransferase